MKMKVKKSQLRMMVREAVHRKILQISAENKNLAECVNLCVQKAPFLKEYKEIKTQQQLLEFFGPFKKLQTKDLEKMSQDNEVKAKKKDFGRINDFVKSVESARKNLANVSLSSPSAVNVALEAYISSLTDLYQVMSTVDLTPEDKAKISKPFAVAAYTLKNLSQSLTDAAEELFSAIPPNSPIYKAGQEASEVEKAYKSSLKSPGQMVKDLFSGHSRGMGVGRSAPK